MMLAFIQGPVFEKTYKLQYVGGEVLYGFSVLFRSTASFGWETTNQSSLEGLGTTNRTTLQHEVVYLKLWFIQYVNNVKQCFA